MSDDGRVPICDAHHHLWDVPAVPYGVDELHADLATVEGQVGSTVFVECGAWYRSDGPEHLRPVGETEWVVRHADADLVRGIVGFADLRLGDAVEEVLGAHVDAGDGRFRGIRHRATWDRDPLIRPGAPDPGPELLRDPQFRAGYAVMARAGLSFDAWVYFPQLPEVVELARTFPECSIVVNHFGGPIGLGSYAGRRPEVMAAWRPLVADLAACPNVTMKLGGIGMPIYGLGWHKRATPPDVEEVAATWRDDVRFCIDAFGVERCMFESNFPVDKLSISYRTVWDAFDVMTEDLTAADRRALFHDTAHRVYRLDDSLGGRQREEGT